MVGLGREKLWRIGDFRHNRRTGRKTRRQFLHDRKCFRTLLWRMREDRRPILRTDIRTLAISGCRIMDGEEHFQKLTIRNPRWIKTDSDRFRMPGSP